MHIWHIYDSQSVFCRNNMKPIQPYTDKYVCCLYVYLLNSCGPGPKELHNVINIVRFLYLQVHTAQWWTSCQPISPTMNVIGKCYDAWPIHTVTLNPLDNVKHLLIGPWSSASWLTNQFNQVGNDKRLKTDIRFKQHHVFSLSF